MVIRIPERKYIEVLIAGKVSSPILVEDLTNHKIQIPKDKELIAIYEDLVKTNPEYFTTDGAEPDPDWLKDFGLSPMFYYRWKKPTDLSLKGCDGVFKMMEDPNVMRYIHLLAFSGVAKDDIELILNARYNISYESEYFQMAFQYFCNYDDWTYADKELYSDGIVDVDLRKHYKEALHEDRGQLLWDIGLGTDPKMSIEEALKDMFNDAYRFFKRFQKNRAAEARDYAALAVKISDRVEGIKSKEETAQDLISQLQIKLSNQESRPDPKQKIINLTELNIELPTPTKESIPDLTTLMLQEDKPVVEDTHD